MKTYFNHNVSVLFFIVIGALATAAWILSIICSFPYFNFACCCCLKKEDYQTYFEIHWNRFSDMVIDKAIPGNYTMNDKLIRWNVKELDLKEAKNVKILFHSSDTIPERILRGHEFPGFGYGPIPSVPQKLYLPSL